MSGNEKTVIPAAEFKKVSLEYERAHAEPLVALSELTFTVGAGEFVALVGPSGCGKSSALRLLAGLLKPTRGRVSVAGRDPATAKSKHQVSVVFQGAALLDWRTVRGNVSLPFEVGRSLPRADVAGRIDELIQLVGLGGFESSYPSELSGGMQQRVALARALVGHPPPSLILMDEPFASVDQITRERLNQELETLWLRYRPAVFFITHSIAEACFLADRVIVMTGRPGTVAATIEIPFERPRKEEIVRSLEFFEISRRIRELLNHV